jgi:histidinol dehydrogenase
MKIITGFEKAKKLLDRSAAGVAQGNAGQEKAVRQIIDGVRNRGDAALFEYTEKFDRVKLASLEVGKAPVKDAFRRINKELLDAMKLAAKRIAVYHTAQKKALLKENSRSKLGWLIRPLRSVGVHVPGFSAPLPSSLLMTAIPARVAGVKEVILVTPPQADGEVSPVTLAAAGIAGVDRIFSIGGAQAVAALAYGTETVPAVDKICGPGNIYLTLAKKMVYGTVGIDGLYGPSEVVIIADETANAPYVAADLQAQAEHGNASAILIATSRKVADSINKEVAKQLKSLTRRDIAAESLEKKGLIVTVNTVDEAVELANLYAPEHLCLVVENAAAYAKKVRNAGCLFVGENSIEALVDYVAGPSHVLPTEGTARFGSGLNILDFVKIISLVKTGSAEIIKLGRAASIIARAEGLDAHARAVEKRLYSEQGGS